MTGRQRWQTHPSMDDLNRREAALFAEMRERGIKQAGTKRLCWRLALEGYGASLAAALDETPDDWILAIPGVGAKLLARVRAEFPPTPARPDAAALPRIAVRLLRIADQLERCDIDPKDEISELRELAHLLTIPPAPSSTG